MNTLINTKEAFNILGLTGRPNYFRIRMKAAGIEPKKGRRWWDRKDIELLRDDLLDAEEVAPNEVTNGDIHRIYVEKMKEWVGDYSRSNEPRIPSMFPKTYATRESKRLPNWIKAVWVYDKATFLRELDERYSAFFQASIEDVWMRATEACDVLGLSGTFKSRTVDNYIKKHAPHVKFKFRYFIVKCGEHHYRRKLMLAYKRSDILKLKKEMI